MMIPRQAPLAGTAVAVFDKRKREGGRAKAAEPVALAAGGRDLPARRRRGRLAAGGRVVMEDKDEPAAFAGREREPARRREVGLLARKLGDHHAGGAAFERFLHGPQGIAWARH